MLCPKNSPSIKKNVTEIYNLKHDKLLVKRVQEVSLDPKSSNGFKIEDGLLFGSPEWFHAIEIGKIPSETINGTLSRVYMSGHNDYPEFEVDSDGIKTQWTREGDDSAYVVNRQVKLTYVIQKFKRPISILGPTTKTVLQIDIQLD